MAKSQTRRARPSSSASIARAVAAPGAAAATAASYNSNSSVRAVPVDVTAALALMRRSGRRESCSDRLAEIRVCVRGHHIELHDARGDFAIRADDEHVPRVGLSVGRAVLLGDGLVRIARENDREARVMRPVGLRGIGVGTDADHDDFLSVVEELGVLITVLLHLNRSALGPCLREEGDHDRLAAIVAELDRVLEEPVAGRAGQGEVGGVLSDVRGGRGGAWY